MKGGYADFPYGPSHRQMGGMRIEGLEGEGGWGRGERRPGAAAGTLLQCCLLALLLYCTVLTLALALARAALGSK